MDDKDYVYIVMHYATDGSSEGFVDKTFRDKDKAINYAKEAETAAKLIAGMKNSVFAIVTSLVE